MLQFQTKKYFSRSQLDTLHHFWSNADLRKISRHAVQQLCKAALIHSPPTLHILWLPQTVNETFTIYHKPQNNNLQHPKNTECKRASKCTTAAVWGFLVVSAPGWQHYNTGTLHEDLNTSYRCRPHYVAIYAVLGQSRTYKHYVKASQRYTAYLFILYLQHTLHSNRLPRRQAACR